MRKIQSVLITFMVMLMSSCDVAGYSLDSYVENNRPLVIVIIVVIVLAILTTILYAYLYRRNYNNFAKGLRVRTLPSMTKAILLIGLFAGLVILVILINFDDPVVEGDLYIPIPMDESSLVLVHSGEDYELLRETNYEVEFEEYRDRYSEGYFKLYLPPDQYCYLLGNIDYFLRYQNNIYYISTGVNMGLYTYEDLVDLSIPVSCTQTIEDLDNITRVEHNDIDIMIDEIETVARIRDFQIILNPNTDFNGNYSPIEIDGFPFLKLNSVDDNNLNALGYLAINDNYYYELQDLVDNGYFTTSEIYGLYSSHLREFQELQMTDDWECDSEYCELIVQYNSVEVYIGKVIYRGAYVFYIYSNENHESYNNQFYYSTKSNILFIHQNKPFLSGLVYFEEPDFCVLQEGLTCSFELPTLHNIDSTELFLMYFIEKIEEYNINQ